MAQSALRPGGDGDLKRVLAAWAVLTAVATVATDLGIAGSAAGTAGLYFVYRGALAVRKAVESRSISLTAIGSLAGTGGAVAVQGTAKPVDGAITAPLSGADSVAYWTRIKQETPNRGEGGGGETTKFAENDARPFVVDDGTGAAYVDPDGAEVLLTTDDEVSVPGGQEPPARVREFVERETDLDPVARRERHYEESRIDVGDTVYVTGSPDPDGAAGADAEATTALTDGPDVPRYYVSDDPEHGLSRRLLGEAFTAFLIAAILLGITYFVFVT